MRHLFRLVRHQFLGATALFLVVGGFAMAKTGDPLRLGLTNNADAPTTIVQSKNGPVLTLKAKAGQPALKVNTTKAIEHLNASLFRGKKPKDFAAAGSAYTKAESDARYSTAKTLVNTNYFKNAPADMTEVDTSTFKPTLECTGTVVYFVGINPNSDGTQEVSLYVGGVLRDSRTTDVAGGTIVFVQATPPTGLLDYAIKVRSIDATEGSAGGNVVIVEYEWC